MSAAVCLRSSTGSLTVTSVLSKCGDTVVDIVGELRVLVQSNSSSCTEWGKQLCVSLLPTERKRELDVEWGKNLNDSQWLFISFISPSALWKWNLTMVHNISHHRDSDHFSRAPLGHPHQREMRIFASEHCLGTLRVTRKQKKCFKWPKS